MTDILREPAIADRQPTGVRASLGEFWFYFSENRGAVIGLWVFVCVCILAILADVIAPHAPATQYRDVAVNDRAASSIARMSGADIA